MSKQKQVLTKENKMFERIRIWIVNRIIKNYDIISNIVSAILSIICSMLASLFYTSLTDNASDGTKIFIEVVFVIIVLLIIFLLSLLSQWIKSRIIEKEHYNEYIKNAYLLIQELSCDSQGVLHNKLSTALDQNSIAQWASDGIQLVVNGCYDFFHTTFGNGIELIEQTAFEVTFMTLSYIDGEITIPYSCNRNHSTPTSMLMRKEDKTIYKSTITAEIYKEAKENKILTIKIIPDTSINYNFIYDSQKESAKSSIVVPVTSRNGELLGTLVVYCNQTNFFKEKDRQFWQEMMQLFTVEIGTYKIILDSSAEGGSKPF